MKNTTHLFKALLKVRQKYHLESLTALSKLIGSNEIASGTRVALRYLFLNPSGQLDPLGSADPLPSGVSMDTHFAFLERSIEHCLSEEDLAMARAEQTDDGVPVVFLANGHAVDIVTGQLQPSDIPPAERICYFNFTTDTAVLIARATNTTPAFARE